MPPRGAIVYRAYMGDTAIMTGDISYVILEKCPSLLQDSQQA